jgi:hypothetical protein
MAFTWTGQPAAGIDLSDDDLAALELGKPFETQADAEAWLTAVYGELSDAGLTSVDLHNGDELVYTMSLEEA